jgi:tRNA A37 threonylcarbamoyladenosine dehydratase
MERSLLLVGDKAVESLGRAHVILFGLGGVGSFAAEALARSGVGKLSLVEYDEVSNSNRNRQLPALCSTIGLPKVDVVRSRLLDINPDISISCFPLRMTGENLVGILEAAGGAPDFIADAIDDLPAKTSLIVAAKERGIPLISAMGAAFRLDPSKLEVGDISTTHTCPLARRLRRSLREAGISEGVPVVWSKEAPMKAWAGGVATDGATGGSARDVDNGMASDAADDMAYGVSCGAAGDSAYDVGSSLSSRASMIFVPASAGILMASYIIMALIAKQA